MRKYVTGKKAVEILGVHQQTLYNWEKQGLIKTIRTNGGKRLYDVESYLNDKEVKSNEENKLKICYVRVSSKEQQDDLERQIAFMKNKFPRHIIVKDIGSGINLDRKGLNKIINWAIDGKVQEIVIAYKNRLARFGYAFIERLVEKYSDGEIIVLNEIHDKEPEKELFEDVMQVMNVFVAKMNDLHKYKHKK